jgi:type III restriction enzyme
MRGAVLEPAIRAISTVEAQARSSWGGRRHDRGLVSYAKNYLAVHFRLDYVNADGDISNYYPDFLVKLSNNRMVVVETKGLEDLDVPLKMQRLRQWCEDINRVQADVVYDFVYVDQESFEEYKPTSFRQLMDGFREYK